ncbi:MAG: PHP domain-containing protein [Anaerolineaceae bacterium]|nr:PHP domain-containing protein [Anaerolineaceae bacterium]
MDNRQIDLHLHTTASDGRLTPTELVLVARRLKLTIISITDHDTTDGIPVARVSAQGNLTIIPGIELSTVDNGDDVHMLGYYIDITNDRLQTALSDFREARDSRARKIVNRLAELHMPIRWEQVQEAANGGAIGRPHIARVMVETGHVGSVGEAFEKYLYTGGPAYIARKRLTPEEGIQLIHSAGGVAILAHPGLVKDYESLIQRLVTTGLDGVEINHPKNSSEVRTRLWELAKQYNLITTGGSDYHNDERGPMASEVPPDGCVEMLEARARQYHTETE